MVFHGTGGSAAAAQRDCCFSALIKSQNFVAVYPNATRETNPDKTPQFQVDYEFQRGCKVDDVRFIKTLRDRLVKDLKLDPDAVFATGMSNGGDMSYFLASQKKPFVKAIAPVAGTMMVSWGKGLNPTRQTSILAIHSRDDKITLWEGDLDNRDGWGAYYNIEAVMNLWAMGQGPCSDTRSARRQNERSPTPQRPCPQEMANRKRHTEEIVQMGYMGI